MKVLVKILLAVVFTALAFLMIFGLLNLATGREYGPRGGGWLVIPLFCWFGASAVVEKTGYWTREAAVGAVRAGIRAGGVAKSFSDRTSSVIDEARQRESARSTRPVDFPCSEDKKTRQIREFVCGAKDAMILAGNPLPELSSAQQGMLEELYGVDWVTSNRDLIASCLVFLDEYRFVSDLRLQESGIFQEGAPQACLLNALNCAILAGGMTQPTIPRAEADFLAFALSLSIDDPEKAMSNPESNARLLLLAVQLRESLTQ